MSERPRIDGFLLIDKAPGWTSHDVVARVRGATKVKKVGHAGTLDPMASGLLVLGLGRATRLLRFVQGAPKEYVARAMFGVATDSLDADGAVLSRDPMPVDQGAIEAVLSRFRGEILQVPPMVSALQVEGRRLYELAREGKEIEREPRPVTVYGLDLIDFAPSDYPEAVFRVRCSAGTYVRSLADDIARALGGRAHLTALRRVRNGSLEVMDAATVDDLIAAVEADTWPDLLLEPAEGLADLPMFRVPPDLEKAVRNGLAVPRGALASLTTAEGPVRFVGRDDRLLAVYDLEAHRAAPEVVLS